MERGRKMKTFSRAASLLIAQLSCQAFCEDRITLEKSVLKVRRIRRILADGTDCCNARFQITVESFKPSLFRRGGGPLFHDPFDPQILSRRLNCILDGAWGRPRIVSRRRNLFGYVAVLAERHTSFKWRPCVRVCPERLVYRCRRQVIIFLSDTQRLHG